ncbi:MAG: exodeoxyribonuclease III [Planctomycetes bacterium]|jgi:exodeoxyribonuclease-3|nr:exodeoxyribonuclease III [Planctomycetota bacterium]MCL4731437.1 exodeoxyribonuclease III [Planctomycetota bacterium]
MLIATWNVNSLRVRLAQLLQWLKLARPDVVCLQEIKMQEADFPFDEIGAAGYECAVHGQKTYNGVAVLSKLPIEDVVPGFAGEEGQARLIEAVIDGVHVLSAYCPNGETPSSDKFRYKQRFFSALRAHLDNLGKSALPLCICGDFNVAPEEKDVWDPAKAARTCGFHPEERRWLKHLTDWGLHDSLRLVDDKGGQYSWWDYRTGGFRKNEGMRIDQIWVSDGLRPRVRKAWIDTEPRGWDRASDHTPVLAQLEP